MKAKLFKPLNSSKKEFIQRLLILALPIMGQNLLISSVSFVDTLMIGMVGEVQLAAVGLANQLFFLITLFYFGVSSGAAIFVSQYWGSQDLKRMHKVIGIALIINLAGSLVATIGSLFFPRQLLMIFTKDASVVELGSQYLVIVAVSYLFTAVVMIYSAALRSTTDARTPLYTSALSIVVNVILNYVLIFGKLGFPKLGVAGAAIATAIARLAEMLLLLYLIYGKKRAVAASIKDLFSFDKELVKLYLITCTPVILNEIFWSLGMTAYKVAYAKMGVEVIAAVNVIEAIQGLFFVVLMGISNASAIMVGNKIGANEIPLARTYAKNLLVIAFIMGSILAGVLITFSSALLIPFKLSSVGVEMTRLTLISVGMMLPIKAFNMVIIVGILRSGGDTHFSMFTELFGVWVIGVPAAFIGVLLLHLPLNFLYLFVGLEEIYKVIMGLFRVRSGKWINRLSITEQL